MSMKEMRKTVEEIDKGGVTNRETLIKAVPNLVKFKQLIAVAKRTLKASTELAERLEAKCSKYALAHESVFDGGCLDVSQVDVKSGDLTIEGTEYHFVSGYGNLERTEQGKVMNQEFLKSLPDSWTKSVLKIDLTAINLSEVSDEKLKENGIQRGVKNVWSEKE